MLILHLFLLSICFFFFWYLSQPTAYRNIRQITYRSDGKLMQLQLVLVMVMAMTMTMTMMPTVMLNRIAAGSRTVWGGTKKITSKDCRRNQIGISDGFVTYILYSSTSVCCFTVQQWWFWLSILRCHLLNGYQECVEKKHRFFTARKRFSNYFEYFGVK